MVLLSAAFSDGRTGSNPCLSQEDVLRYQDRSRTGISLTCTDGVWMQAMRRQVAR